MTEHLPECHCQCAYDCGGPCICDALRACEERMLKDTATRHLALIKMIGLGILQTRADELRACEDRVIGEAVQRVEALPHSLECVTRDANYNRPCNCLRGDALDAIKGDQQ